MMHDAAGTDAWSMALIGMYGLGLWALAVAGVVVLMAQVGRARGRGRDRGRPTHRPWI
jgi:hypothetical protein